MTKRSLGYGGGYRSLHGQGFFQQHPHDPDGANNDGEPPKAAEVRQEQKYPGARRFWQRQDAVFLQAIAAASPFLVGLHRSERDPPAGDRFLPGAEEIPDQVPEPH